MLDRKLTRRAELTYIPLLVHFSPWVTATKTGQEKGHTKYHNSNTKHDSGAHCGNSVVHIQHLVYYPLHIHWKPVQCFPPPGHLPQTGICSCKVQNTFCPLQKTMAVLEFERSCLLCICSSLFPPAVNTPAHCSSDTLFGITQNRLFHQVLTPVTGGQNLTGKLITSDALC